MSLGGYLLEGLLLAIRAVFSLRRHLELLLAHKTPVSVHLFFRIFGLDFYFNYYNKKQQLESRQRICAIRLELCLLLINYIQNQVQYKIKANNKQVILFGKMSNGRSLSPAQIQYLRIGPKTGGSQQIKNQLTEVLRKEKIKQYAGDTSASNSLNKIPKFTYGQFEKTVNNFGVLMNKNFGNDTLVHQSQKFGKIAKHVNQLLIQQKDKPIFNEKKNALLKKIKDRSDNRTSIKTVYDFMGEKLHVTLKSFSLQSERSNEGGLPIPYLRFLISHVNSSRIVKIIETAIKAEGNQIVVQFDKIQGRASHFSNNQAKYQNQTYQFERLGQILKINLPYVQFHHVETDFHQKAYILNKQIIQIIQSNFDNVPDIVQKYLQASTLKESIQARNRQKKQQEQERHHNQDDQ